MANPPNLLDDDGTASVATALMMSHHAFRRDVALFSHAIERKPSPERAEALREEWQWFRGALHGHHEKEDTDIFPGLTKEKPQLGTAIGRLSADHQRIDPLLVRGDRAFAELRAALSDAASVVDELKALLFEHLTSEEATIVQFLRGANEFPPPADDNEAAMYAQGFAWSMHGIAPTVLERVHAMLPENMRRHLPAARTAFEDRFKRTWGSVKIGASTTPVPDWLLG